MKKTAMTLACLFLVLLLLPLFGSPAQAMTTADGNWEYTQLSGGKARIDKYLGDAYSVVIPDTIGTGYVVTQIGSNAFSYKSMTIVTIPSTVTTIGNRAFSHCENLMDVNGGESLVSIGEGAFSDCTELGSFRIPEGVAEIDDYTFYNCRNLYALNIPASVEVINDDFYDCRVLKIINYGGDYLQWQDVLIPDADGRAALEKCTIWYDGGDVTGTGVCGAQGKNLKWTLVQTDNYQLTIEGTGEMEDYNDSWEGYTGVPWSENDYYSSEYDLVYQDLITQVTIKSGVTGIGNYAFDGCEMLQSVDIPATVKRIGVGAFRDCTLLENVIIPSGVKTIPDYGFYACENLTNVTIPSGVTSIGNLAFAYCYRLNSVSIPATVKTIEGGAFEYTDCLASLTIPDGVTTIEQATFRGSMIQDLVIPASVKTIEDYAFEDANALTDVWFGDTSAQWANLVSDDNLGYWCDVLKTVNVHYKPVISMHPLNVNTTAGSNVQFTVSATGDALAYQWQVCEAGKTTWKDSPATGNKTPILTIPATASRDGYKYRCVVTNRAGKTISNPATLTVSGAKPTITTHPSNVTKAAGSGSATFKVVASGSGLSYQWQYLAPGGSWKDSPATGNKTATLTVPATASRSGYQYRCVVKNSGGTTTSSAATLTVLAITTQPKSVTKAAGGNVTFTVKASGTGLTYQWQVSTNGGSSWSDSPATGNKTATLTVPATLSRSGYKYRCIVKLGSLSVTSSAATLTVTP